MESFLKYTGYFRASRYGKYILSFSNVFKEKQSHEMLYKIYNFDVVMRDLLFGYCRKAEIQFKTHLSNAVSLKTNDPVFYLKREIYTPSKGEKDRKTRNKNIKFFNKAFKQIIYDEKGMRTNKIKYPELNAYGKSGDKKSTCIPSWAYFSYIEFGNFINIYSYLNLQYQKEVFIYGYSKDNYSKDVSKKVDTWLNAIRTVRNICAHHSKIVGMNTAAISIDEADKDIIYSQQDLMSRLYALKKILNTEDSNLLKNDLRKLIKHTKIDIYVMNILPANWEEQFDRISLL